MASKEGKARKKERLRAWKAQNKSKWNEYQRRWRKRSKEKSKELPWEDSPSRGLFDLNDLVIPQEDLNSSAGLNAPLDNDEY